MACPSKYTGSRLSRSRHGLSRWRNKFYLRIILWYKKATVIFLHCSKIEFMCKIEFKVQSSSLSDIGFFHSLPAIKAVFPVPGTVLELNNYLLNSSKHFCNTYCLLYTLTHLILSIAPMRQVLLLYIN